MVHSPTQRPRLRRAKWNSISINKWNSFILCNDAKVAKRLSSLTHTSQSPHCIQYGFFLCHPVRSRTFPPQIVPYKREEGLHPCHRHHRHYGSFLSCGMFSCRFVPHVLYPFQEGNSESRGFGEKRRVRSVQDKRVGTQDSSRCPKFAEHHTMRSVTVHCARKAQWRTGQHPYDSPRGGSLALTWAVCR